MAMPQKKQSIDSYADEVNEKFNIDNTDIYVTFRERMETFLAENPHVPVLYTEFGKEFKRRNPLYKTFEDLYPHLVGCGEGLLPISGLAIDKTSQRPQVPDWIIEIGGNFSPFLVNSISLNVVDDNTCVWDGQQTATALTLVAMYFFGMSLEKAFKTVFVPGQMFASNNKEAIRNRFISHNDGSLQRPLTRCDLAEQIVYAVRLDASTRPFYKRIESIQNSLEDNNMFFSDETRADVTRAGAVSRYTEIWNHRKFIASDIINVIKYHGIARPNHPVEPLEIDNMAHIFMFAREAGIKVDDDYIEELADILEKITKNTWGKTQKGKFGKHGKVARCYRDWRLNQIEKGMDPALIMSRCNQSHVAPAWLLQTLKANGFSRKTPQLTGNYKFKFTIAELTA